MSEIDGVLAARAARQRMLVTVSDVEAAGGSRAHVHNRIAGRRWRRVDDGVYLIEGAPFPWETQLLAAVLAAGGGAVASHLAAARLWGLPGFGTAGLELSIPRGRRYRRPGIRSHESTDLDRCAVVSRSEVPVTDIERTLLDLGRYVGVRRLERAVESARRARHTDWESLIRSHTRHARRGRAGVRRLRTVILDGAGRREVTDSEIELIVLGLMRAAGLPEPVLHHRVTVDGRFVAEVDLAYPRLKIAIECDGSVHLEEEVRDRDLPRQNDLVLAGWTILRFSWNRVVQRPDSVVREIRDAIARAEGRA